jgi:hypothetical protein
VTRQFDALSLQAHVELITFIKEFFFDKLMVRLASQEIIRLLWKAKVHYRVHRSQQPIPILIQIYPIYTHQTYYRHTVLILSSIPRVSIPTDVFPLGWPTKILY